VGAALLITLREGIEAALLVSILLAYLRQLGRADLRSAVWWGTGLAVALSVAAGAIIFSVAGEFEGTAEATFEGLVTLAAVGVLTWMIFWMRRQGSRIRSQLQERVDTALVAGGTALGSLAFFAVLREGIETALFLFGADRATSTSDLAAIIGGLIGLVIATGLGVLLYRGAIKMNVRTFFKITGALILVVAAGLFAFSVHELQEAGYLPFLTSTAFDIDGALTDEGGVGALLRALVGYNADPSWLEVVAWIGYVLVTAFFYFRPTQQAVVVGDAAGASKTPAHS
jgi:high-affinity iron transporter